MGITYTAGTLVGVVIKADSILQKLMYSYIEDSEDCKTDLDYINLNTYSSGGNSLLGKSFSEVDSCSSDCHVGLSVSITNELDIVKRIVHRDLGKLFECLERVFLSLDKTWWIDHSFNVEEDKKDFINFKNMIRDINNLKVMNYIQVC